MKASIKKGITLTLILGSMGSHLNAADVAISNTQVGTGSIGAAVVSYVGIKIGDHFSQKKIQELMTPVNIYNEEMDFGRIVEGDRVVITYEGFGREGLINDLNKQRNELVKKIINLEQAYNIALSNQQNALLESQARVRNSNSANYIANTIATLETKLQTLEGDIEKLLDKKNAQIVSIKEITLDANAEENVRKHIEMMEAKGFVTKEVKLLSQAQMQKLRSYLKRSTVGGAVIITLGVAFLVEELTAGYVAGKLEEAMDFNIDF